jgi:hypothetical protein
MSVSLTIQYPIFLSPYWLWYRQDRHSPTSFQVKIRWQRSWWQSSCPRLFLDDDCSSLTGGTMSLHPGMTEVVNEAEILTGGFQTNLAVINRFTMSTYTRLICALFMSLLTGTRAMAYYTVWWSQYYTVIDKYHPQLSIYTWYPCWKKITSLLIRMSSRPFHFIIKPDSILIYRRKWHLQFTPGLHSDYIL